MLATAERTSTSETESAPEVQPGAPDYSDMDDAELIAAYLDGDERAFSELYRRYQGPIQNFLYRRYGLPPEQQEDLYQMTMTRVYRHAHRYDPDKKASTWIFHIASNFAKNVFRNRDRDPQVKFSTLAKNQDHNDRPLQWADEDADVEREFDRKVTRCRVLKAVRNLPPHHRFVFAARELATFGEGVGSGGAGASYEIVAEITGVAIGTVKSRINRARKTFFSDYRRLEEEGEIPDEQFAPERKWWPPELRAVFEARGWRLEDGCWHMPSRRSPRCFCDAFLEAEPEFLAHWFMPQEEELPVDASELSRRQLAKHRGGPYDGKQYKGVGPARDRFRAHLQIGGEGGYLGTFPTIEDAAAARDDALVGMIGFPAVRRHGLYLNLPARYDLEQRQAA